MINYVNVSCEKKAHKSPIFSIRRRVGMADEADSKSVVGNNVRVQVPPPASLP